MMASGPDDTLLIEASLGGDTSAFGQLVEKYQLRLFNTICRVTSNREEAEDVVQEAFVQAYVKLSTFRQNSAFFTWLYRIAFNTAVSRGRRRKIDTSIDLTRERTGDEPVDDDENPEQRMERLERADQVQAGLARLSEEHRSILILRDMQDCTYEEIAEILNLAIGTVRSRIHRARVQLREELKETLQNSE